MEGEPSSLIAAAAAMNPSTPSALIVKYLHAIPRFNLTFHRVSNHFNPDSSTYAESLGIMALLPASILIVYLVSVLMYLLTRCCDRKSRQQKNGCSKCTLIFFSILCAIAVGAGLYGNDELHKGISDVFGSGRKVERLVKNVRNQTESLKYSLKTKVTVSELEETFDKPVTMQNRGIFESVRWVKDNTTLAINALEAVSYLIKSSHSEATIKRLFDNLEFYEAIRMPATLGFLLLILVLCIMLVIALIRSSRCTLILFSVVGLLSVTVCWILSSGYLVSAIALGDFCVRPQEFICNQQKVPDIHYTNCGTLGTNSYILRLNESRDNIDRAKEALFMLSSQTNMMYPRDNLRPKIERFDNELKNSKKALAELSSLLDRRTVEQHYRVATRSLCGPSLIGLTLMLVAGLVMALMMSILVCVDSHVWIYLGSKRPKGDKMETMPLYATNPNAPMIGGANVASAPGTSMMGTTNRTLLHHQQQSQFGSNGNGLSTGTIGRNGSAMRGLAYNGESPPPEYNVVVHDKRQIASGHQTLGRLPSQHQNPYGSGPGKYATLSKQCKTLQSNDFY